ncbi:MAG: NTP transferase domain-containing protein [Synergistaceae bacterium]|jgi:NDP-sugar pyrophosphorylase family protein|nr:NTP transferase domain-containing protein [Synergistaceae bacterium]
MLPVAILAGGLAERIRPLSERIPKSLIEIAGRPFIDHQLELLRSSGVRRVVLCLGFLGERIAEHVGDGMKHGLDIRCSFDGEARLGTGGALRKALPLLGDEFFVLYGDSYLPIDFGAVEAAFEASGGKALMTVYRNDGRWDESNAVFLPGEGDWGVVKTYSKVNRTPDMKYVDYGLSCCRASELPREARAYFDLAEIFTGLAREGSLAGFEAKERFYEIGSFAGMDDFALYMTKKQAEIK